MILNKEIKTIIAKIANRNSIRHEDCENAYLHFISELKKEMMSDFPKNIKIHNLGRFEIQEKRIEEEINRLKGLGKDTSNLELLRNDCSKRKHIRNDIKSKQQ